MCGFVGLYLNKEYSLEKYDFSFILKKMTKALLHRGPDDEGIFIDRSEKLGLGFQRLSILDLNKKQKYLCQ